LEDFDNWGFFNIDVRDMLRVTQMV